MILTALDLEMNQPSGKIIQIGAVMGDLHTGKILDRVNCLINSGEQLNPFITDLTGITDKMIYEEGIDIVDAYELLNSSHKKHNAFMNPITWGGGDSIELKEQLPKEIDWCFGRRWIDCKTLYISIRLANGQKLQGGLAKAMTKFGLNFEGRKHNALDDAYNTFRFYRRLVQLMPKMDKGE